MIQLECNSILQIIDIYENTRRLLFKTFCASETRWKLNNPLANSRQLSNFLFRDALKNSAGTFNYNQ